jgi:hypothetical protein
MPNLLVHFLIFTFQKPKTMRLFLFSLLLLPHILFSQQANYLPFEYNGNWGITDTSLNEIIKPYYYRYEAVPSEEALLFTNFENGIEYLYFNLKDGSQKKYENYDLSSVKIENENYSLIQDANKYYLKNEVSNNLIMLTLPIEEMNKLGKDYIIGKYDLAEEIPKNPRKGKNGMVIPEAPKPYNFNKNFVIFKNDKTLPKVFKIATINYTPLYIDINAEKRKKSNSETELIETVELELERNLDYIVFNSDVNYELYSADFKPIKKFIYKGDYGNIAEKCSKIVGKALSIYPYEIAPNAIGYDSSVDGYMPMPEFESVFENDVYKIISTDRNKPTVICESKNKLIYDIRSPDQIVVVDPEKNEYISRFSFNKNTFKLYLPLKYYPLLKLIPITIKK